MLPKIRFEIWAGALGVPIERKKLDPTSLSPDRQVELQRLVEASRVLQLPASPVSPATNRDDNQFKFIFDFDDREQIVRIPNEKVSAELRQLIDFVQAHGS